MAILNKYKRWQPILKTDLSQFWDIVISLDKSKSVTLDNNLTERCLVSLIDVNKEECLEENGICSCLNYKWDNSINDAHTYKFYDKEGHPQYTNNKDEVPIGIPYEKITLLEDIGYVGIDNGLIYYGGPGSVTNKEFFDIFVNSIYEIKPDDFRLHLKPVTGNTDVYSYEMSLETDEEGRKYYALKGGFFQGFYKLYGFDYQVLPYYLENSWTIETEIKPTYYIIDDKSLNVSHPQNNGIFFYMGTRAEDKFIQFYNCDLSKYLNRKQTIPEYCPGFLEYGYFAPDQEETEEKCDPCLFFNNEAPKTFNKTKAEYLAYFLNTYGISANKKNNVSATKEALSSYIDDPDYYEPDIVISGETITTKDGKPIDDSGYFEIKTDNKFLTFNRTKYGFTAANWDEDSMIVLTGSTNDIHTDNLYLLMNRSKSGYTVSSLDKYYSNNKKEYNFIPTIVGNAFALVANEDGSISYRYLVKDCNAKEGYQILTEKTFPNLVKNDEWNTITAVFTAINGLSDDANKLSLNDKKMKISIYVNGFLKFVSKELPIFDFRELPITYDKQEGVPFNISLGGGTQGLCDSVWLDYWYAFQKILPIEANFAGTFIGDIRSFKFYDCALELTEIQNNNNNNKKSPNKIS